MPGKELALNRRWLIVVLALLLVGGLLAVSAAAVPAPAEAAEVDPRVPGRDNPVGPTNWQNLVDQPNFVNFSEDATVTNVKFLDGFDITNGAQVTIRNCHVINPGSFWTILVRNGSLLMEDCQIGDYSTAAGQRGIGGDNVTLRRVKIVGHSDGIKAGHNSLYEQVWVTDLREFQPDDHPDALQDDGGNGGYIIRYSRLEGIDVNGARGTSAAIIKSDLGPIDGVTFEGNVLDGGQYVLMVDKGSYPAPTNVVIRNNAFGRNAVFGVLLRHDDAGITWEGNFWEDTGEFIDEDGDPGGDPGPGPGPDPDPDPDPDPGPGGGPFADVSASHTFANDIAWLADEGITRGCNPPSNTRFCPGAQVTRGQMAAFLVRALGLSTGAGTNQFNDDNGSVFENDIDKLATAGISRGCNPPLNTKFCPDTRITRGQMAAFLARARGLSNTNTDYFHDDDGSIYENDINRIAKAGITKGCDPPANEHYCPNSNVTRGQMAAFLARAFS
jgi:hypothetical protein